MASTKVLKKWWECFADDDERRFFVGKTGNAGLARHHDYVWRSVSSLARESGLSEARVEEIIEKYHKLGMVNQHDRDPEKWGYWERTAPESEVQTHHSAAEADQVKRLAKAIKDRKK